MASKKNLLKDRNSLLLLLFSLFCFSLIVADAITRVEDRTLTESGSVVVTSFPTGQVPISKEPEEELTTEELDRLIEETMSGDAGSL